jgi:hypothetical protein
MSDIFISYKREEQAIARKLADALERKGWTVWWDPNLRAGEIFDEVIEKALKEAKCVVVLWSNLSVKSEYVKAEATEALEQKKVIPVKIEEVNLPFRFKRVHTPSLLEWDGSEDSSDFRKLVADISEIVGLPAADSRKGQPAREQSTSERVPQQRRLSPQKIVQLRQKWKNQFETKLLERRRAGLRNDVIIRDMRRLDNYPETEDKDKGISPWFRVGLMATVSQRHSSWARMGQAHNG